MWFVQHAAEELGDVDYVARCAEILKKTLKLGWDKEYSGLFHFCSIEGGEPIPGDNDPVDEPIYQQLLTGWSDKLWWVHSEALYSTMLFGELAHDKELSLWYERIFEYTFRTFPNPDKKVGEWIQIQIREGKPQEKVCALPVKDPFHIARNILFILKFLYSLER